MSKLTDNYITFVTQSILEPLSTWIEKEKNVKIPVTEMLDTLELISTSQNDLPQSAKIQSTVPNVVNETKVLQRRRRKPIHNGKTCLYHFEKQNRFCGKKCVPGYDYCDQCIKKKKVREFLSKQHLDYPIQIPDRPGFYLKRINNINYILMKDIDEHYLLHSVIDNNQEREPTSSEKEFYNSLDIEPYIPNVETTKVFRISPNE